MNRRAHKPYSLGGKSKLSFSNFRKVLIGILVLSWNLPLPALPEIVRNGKLLVILREFSGNFEGKLPVRSKKRPQRVTHFTTK